MLQVQKTVVEPDVVVMEIAGRLALGRECQRVEWMADELMDGGRTKIVFDLSKLDSIDSTGIGILVTCCGKIEAAGGQARVAGVQPKIETLIRLTKLDRLIQCHPTLADAVASLGESAGSA